MIVCSCNVLTDQDVREAARRTRDRSTSRVYGCLGCSAQCGRCARTIRKIVDETIGAGALVCPVGCACALHVSGAEATRAHEHRHHGTPIHQLVRRRSSTRPVVAASTAGTVPVR